MNFPVKLAAARGTLLILMALLSGCMLGTRESVEHVYLLDPALPVAKSSGNPASALAATVLVTLPKAQPGFDTPRMVYSLRPHELGYYALNRWVDTPALMLMRPLVRTVEQTGLWHSVVQAPSTFRVDHRLDFVNLALEQQFFSPPARVRLALRAQLIDIKRQLVIDAQDFEIIENMAQDDAYGGALAANRAAHKLLEELADWLNATMNERAPAGR
jgi:cholesterol transport system auxiliary component